MATGGGRATRYDGLNNLNEQLEQTAQQVSEHPSSCPMKPCDLSNKSAHLYGSSSASTWSSGRYTMSDTRHSCIGTQESERLWLTIRVRMTFVGRRAGEAGPDSASQARRADARQTHAKRCKKKQLQADARQERQRQSSSPGR